MSDLRKLNTVKEELARRSFASVKATIMAEDTIIIREGGKRARIGYEEALRIIRAAPNVEAMWSALEAGGLLWPRVAGSESKSNPQDIP